MSRPASSPMKRRQSAISDSHNKHKRQHVVDTSPPWRLLDRGRFKAPIWDSRYNSQASFSRRQPRVLDSNYIPQDSDGGGLTPSDYLSPSFHVHQRMDLTTSFTGQEDLASILGSLHCSSELSQRSTTKNWPDESMLSPPGNKDEHQSSSGVRHHSLESDEVIVEPQRPKAVSKAKQVQKLATQFTKLSKHREDAMNVRIQGQTLRNRLTSLRVRADTISVKLRALLIDTTASRRLLQETLEELHGALTATIRFELEYNKHEDLVDEKEYQLTEMEQRFSEKYGPVTFADDLVLESTPSASEDEEDSFSSSDDEAPTSPVVPKSLSTRDRYDDKVKELRALRAEQADLHHGRIEELRALRAEQEGLHHDRIHHEITVIREKLDHKEGSETPPEISRALVELRDREKDLAERIKSAEDESLRLENAAIAAGEMKSSETMFVTKDEEIISLEQSRLNRHPLLFPFPDIDKTDLHFKVPNDENGLPVGVSDWSLYRLRSTLLDVDLYKAYSEPGMWSKPSSSLQSQAEFDRQLSERILKQWHLESLQNATPVRGPLTSEISNVILPTAMTQVDSTRGQEIQGQEMPGREMPKVSEILRHRRLPDPYLPGLKEEGLPLWNQTRSNPDLDDLYQGELPNRSKNLS